MNCTRVVALCLYIIQPTIAMGFNYNKHNIEYIKKFVLLLVTDLAIQILRDSAISYGFTPPSTFKYAAMPI